MPRFQPDNWARNLTLIEQFVVLAEQAGVTPAQLALKWVLSRGGNVHVIPGTTNRQHLADNVRAAEVEVDQAVLDEADRLINHDTVAGHRYHNAIKPTIDTEEFA
jgi:aryl-alcohol dehydrogenase-like predicted oxidoreductase